MDYNYQGYPAARPDWACAQHKASQVVSAADATGRGAPEASMELTADYLLAGSPGTAAPLFQQEPPGIALRENKRGGFYDSARNIEVVLPLPPSLRLAAQSVQQVVNAPYYHGAMEMPIEAAFIPTRNEQTFRGMSGPSNPFGGPPTPVEPPFNYSDPPNPFAPPSTPNEPEVGDMPGNRIPFATPNFPDEMDRGADIQIDSRLLKPPQPPASYYVQPPKAPKALAVPQRAAPPISPAKYSDQISEEPLLHTFNPGTHEQMRNALSASDRTTLSQGVPPNNRALPLSPPPEVRGEQATKKGRPSNESRKQARKNYSQQPNAGALWNGLRHAAFGSASSAGGRGSIRSIPLEVPVMSPFVTHHHQPSNPDSAALIRGGGSGYAASVSSPSTGGSFGSVPEYSIPSPLDDPSQFSTPFSASVGRRLSDAFAIEAEKRIADAANV